MAMYNPSLFPAAIIASTLFLVSCAGISDSMRLSKHSYEAPVLEDGVYTFRLRPGRCSRDKYSGRSESDCSLKSQRIELIQSGGAYAGDQVMYSWDIFVPTNYSNSHSHMIAGQILDRGSPTLTFGLTAEEGYYVQGKNCFPPSEFGEWHSVKVKVRWDNTKRSSLDQKTPGMILVKCDGRPVLKVDGRPNTIGGPLYLKIGLYRGRGGLDYKSTEVFKAKYREIKIQWWE